MARVMSGQRYYLETEFGDERAPVETLEVNHDRDTAKVELLRDHPQDTAAMAQEGETSWVETADLYENP